MNQIIAILILVTSCWIGSTLITYASGTSSSSSSWGSSSDTSSDSSSGSGQTLPGTSTHSNMGLWDSSSEENLQTKSSSSESTGSPLWDSGSEAGLSSGQDNTISAKSHAASLYDQGVAASSNNDYQKALELFEQALNEDSNNPDILNMLAHTQRKMGKIDEALANYKKALELRPDFPEAREYLGEAYIQAAQQEIETLKSYGREAHENVEDLTKAFKDAAEKL